MYNMFSDVLLATRASRSSWLTMWAAGWKSIAIRPREPASGLW
jgi:hypothetical protein